MDNQKASATPIAHAKLSPSSSSRWLYCTASAEQVQKYKNKTYKATLEGTLAHEIGALCLQDKINPENFLNKRYSDFFNDHQDKKYIDQIICDKAMVNHIQGYIDYCNSFSIGADIFIETKVNFSNWVKNGFGTSDFISIKNEQCNIIDFKYGVVVPVSPERNTQAMIYALGVYQDFRSDYYIKNFNLHIYQPRIGNIGSWSISLKDLLKWSKFLKQQASKCFTKKATYEPSLKTCKWCSHKFNCTHSILEGMETQPIEIVWDS